MTGAGAIDPYLAGNLIGFTVGLVISTLLLVLTVRAARLPGTPASNILLAVCALLWNAGGLVYVMQHPQATSMPSQASVALAIQFTGAGIWPIAILAIWRRLATERWQGVCWRFLTVNAYVNAAVIVGAFWVALAGGWIIPDGLKEFAAYSATYLGVAAAALLMRGPSISRALRLSCLVMLAGLLLTSASVLAQTNITLSYGVRCALGLLSHQSVLLVVVGTFFLFARFRFADLFIRYSVRILLASIAAGAFVLVIDAAFLQQLALSAGVRFFITTMVATGLLVGFARLDRNLLQVVNRWVFRAPDYHNAVRDLGDELRRYYSESEVTAAVERAVRETLGLDDARSIGLSRLPVALWPAEIHDGQVAELEPGNPLASLLRLKDLELLVPVRAEGKVVAALAISPGAARRGLVSQELNYLRSVAEQFGSRLDLLRLEREMVERQSRETLLLQQVTEAELRALRAQINPHFLFNSLNTIANLIVTDPPRAETMTLRLAKVFRHVLAHSSRPLAPIREEIEFLRSYLEIEEARFGSRLQVEIEVAPEVNLDPVPTLILQPVVENALKHGLGPKTGPGRLWIWAKAQGDSICLEVEDDGVGPNGAVNGHGNGLPSNGVGLKNITQRLATLYQDRARVTIEPRNPEGTRVTLVMPRESGRNGHEKPHS